MQSISLLAQLRFGKLIVINGDTRCAAFEEALHIRAHEDVDTHLALHQLETQLGLDVVIDNSEKNCTQYWLAQRQQAPVTVEHRYGLGIRPLNWIDKKAVTQKWAKEQAQQCLDHILKSLVIRYLTDQLQQALRSKTANSNLPLTGDHYDI